MSQSRRDRVVASDAERLLALFGDGWRSLCARSEGGRFHVVGVYATTGELLDAGRAIYQDHDLWVGVHPLGDKPKRGRGATADVAAVHVLPVDLDWQNEAHKGDDLPTEEQVRAALAALADRRLAPTAVVNSGHGVQAYWKLDEPVTPSDGEALTLRMHAALAALGVKPERADLASVLRLPGSINFKTIPVNVELEMLNGDTYDPADLANRLPSVTASQRPATPPPVLNQPDRLFDDPLGPADRLRETWDWEVELVRAGWTLHHRDANGDSYWTRPGKPIKHGESAVLHPGGPFNVYSTDSALVTLRALGKFGAGGTSVSVSPFQFYAATYHGGDLSAAGRALDPQASNGPTARHLSVVPTPAATTGRKAKLTPMSAIRTLRVRWLWDQRIALGTLALLAGGAGVGKSTLAYWMAAKVTKGELPGENNYTPRSVLVCASEDSYHHTVKPRLLAHDADMDRVFRLEIEVEDAMVAPLSLPADLLTVEESAIEVEASLLLLDPLMSRLDVRLDTHRDGEVRRALEPLVTTLERADMACFGLIHHNKSGSTDPMNLVMASTAFGAVARSVHSVVIDPEDETGTTRLFGTVKNNLGRDDQPTKTFAIGEYNFTADDGTTGTTSQIQWGMDSPTTIRAALAASAVGGGSKLGNAVDWLRDYMRKHGPKVNAADVILAGDKAGHARSTLHRARNTLGIESEDTNTYGPRGTCWYDPADSRLSEDDDTPEKPW